MGKILLFYKYVAIEYPKRILKWQQKICADLGLKGRILLGHEGINGTVGGSVEHIERYKSLMHQHELFSDVDFKESVGTAEDFPRMQITVKNEIVAIGIDPDKLTPKNGGIHLDPAQTHALIQENPEDLVILDARNNFESEVGAFTNAIKPDIKTFREFPEYIDQHSEQFANKRVLMYCTGGIRCERASTYVKEKTGAKEVYQMDGGIHKYVEEYPDGFFRGKNYVFDRRIALRINADVLGHCSLCNAASDDFTNCINSECNNHYICCIACLEAYNNTCSDICKELVASNKVKIRAITIGTHGVRQDVAL